MYARFFTKALADMDLLGVQEPFARLFTQGMITREGAKMSKSKGNVVNPMDYVDQYGADTARCYILFIGPPDQGADWSDSGIAGMNRFLARLWRLGAEVVARAPGSAEPTGDPTSVLRKAHWAIDKVTKDTGNRFAFNTAISAVMELVNEIYAHKDAMYGDDAGASQVRFATATAASLLFPFAPHLGAEVYEMVTGGRVWEQPWPEADASLLVADTFELVVQVNGKLRDRIEAPADSSREEQEALARQSERVLAQLNGGQVVKTIVVPGKLVNFVVR
jgi:leucyl-tRNA synthetase